MPRALNSVVITTDDLPRARAFYEGELKLIPVADYHPDPIATQRLWGLDRPYPIRTIILKRRPNDIHGFVKLTHIEGANGRDIRENANSWDQGLFTIAFQAKDSPTKIAQIEKLGYGLLTRPTRHDFKQYGEYYVTQSLIKGPNSVRLSMLERFNAPHPVGAMDDATGFSEIVDCSQAVSDLEATTRFYEMLGLSQLREFHLVGPYYEKSLGIRPDEPFGMRLLGDLEYSGSHIELLHFEQRRGEQLTRQSSPLNYGFAALSFGVKDLEATLAELQRAGVPIVCQPMETDLDGSGPVRTFSCFAPAGILCEVYQAS